MGLEKIVKDFDLFGIETHPISPNPHGLRAKRTSPKLYLTEFLFDCIVKDTYHISRCKISDFSCIRRYAQNRRIQPVWIVRACVHVPTQPFLLKRRLNVV
jgi:hypothetical protein